MSTRLKIPLSPLARNGAVLLACVALAPLAAAAPSNETSHAVTYTFETLDYPGATQTVIYGLNDLGEFGGEYQIGTGQPHAMLGRNGQFESLDPHGVFGDRLSIVGGLNDWGASVGGYADETGIQHGFITQWGFIDTMDFPGHLNTNIVGINDLGTMIGVYWDADGANHAVLRRFAHDTLIDVPGSRETYPLGLNNEGEVVGYWDSDPTKLNSFHRSASGAYTAINVPTAPANKTIALSINDVGQTLGYYVDAQHIAHGFILSRGQYRTIDVPGALLTYALVINNSGQISGEYFDTAGNEHGFLATPHR